MTTKNKETLLELIKRVGPQLELADSIEKAMRKMRGYDKE